jgi:hypothetical protein
MYMSCAVPRTGSGAQGPYYIRRFLSFLSRAAIQAGVDNPLLVRCSLVHNAPVLSNGLWFVLNSAQVYIPLPAPLSPPANPCFQLAAEWRSSRSLYQAPESLNPYV